MARSELLAPYVHNDTCKAPVKRIMDAFVRRQAVEGSQGGYLTHRVRFGPLGSACDRIVLKALIERHFDLEQCYQFMDSVLSRFLADILLACSSYREMRPKVYFFLTRYRQPQIYAGIPENPIWNGVRIELHS